jgi:hypothetical protein
MKTYMLSLLQERPLLRLLACVYWLTFLAICWLSFEGALQYAASVLSKIELITFPRP